MQPRPEPSNFDEKVRSPGLNFIEKHPDCAPKDLKDLWRIARSDLQRSYKHICAYTCRRIVDGSVDHFLPKSKCRKLAYDWSNYRLCCDATNRAKAAKVGLMDPFTIGLGWFAITFPQCDVVLGPDVPKGRRAEAQFTIKALDLNSENLLDARSDMAVAFRDKKVALDFMRAWYPFLAVEIQRQGSAYGASDEDGFRSFIESRFRDPKLACS